LLSRQKVVNVLTYNFITKQAGSQDTGQNRLRSGKN